MTNLGQGLAADRFLNCESGSAFSLSDTADDVADRKAILKAVIRHQAIPAIAAVHALMPKSERQITSLNAVVAKARAVSKNLNIIIFAGSTVLANPPASAQISGIDLIATDATAALQELRRLLGLAAPNPSP